MLRLPEIFSLKEKCTFIGFFYFFFLSKESVDGSCSHFFFSVFPGRIRFDVICVRTSGFSENFWVFMKDIDSWICKI